MLKSVAFRALGALVLFTTLASPVLAGSGRDITFHSETTLDGTTVPPGKYHLAWKPAAEGTFDVTLSQRGKVVAWATGIADRSARPNVNDALAFRVQADGTRVLSEIRFAGKRDVVVIRPTETASNE